MKKNVMMRLSALLLVAVLLTTCVISGTFAKYVTTNSAAEEAEVAKWGVKITANAVDSKEYDGKVIADEETAVLSGDSHLLAPGSSMKFGSLKVTGKPEVAVKVEYSAVLTLTGWDATPNYMPLVFVVNGVDVTGNNAAELKANVEAAIAGYSKEYAADNDLGTSENLTVACYWLYSVDADKDANDTILGTAEPTLSLKISCTVTQLDVYTTPAP